MSIKGHSSSAVVHITILKPFLFSVNQHPHPVGLEAPANETVGIGHTLADTYHRERRGRIYKNIREKKQYKLAREGYVENDTQYYHMVNITRCVR